MITVDELRAMTPQERAALVRALIELAEEDPRTDPLRDPRVRRRRWFGLGLLVTCCVCLIQWTIVLGFTLPSDYQATQWAAAWIGFDVALTLAIGGTALALWRGRQIAVAGMTICGTLLVCDAWFDVLLSWGSDGFAVSVVTALVVELPLAALFYFGAGRLVRLTLHAVWVREGRIGPQPPLWKIRILTLGEPRKRKRRP